jgi:hypothetical protein
MNGEPGNGIKGKAYGKARTWRRFEILSGANQENDREWLLTVVWSAWDNLSLRTICET